jgi:hypothetical protein
MLSQLGHQPLSMPLSLTQHPLKLLGRLEENCPNILPQDFAGTGKLLSAGAALVQPFALVQATVHIRQPGT